MERDEVTFEQAYDQLEDIVSKLEGDDLTIDQAVELYERGVGLIRHCNARLDHAELRISRLTLDANGEPSRAPLDG